MNKSKIIIVVLTILVEIAAFFILQRLGECYPGFQPMFKTPGDGCDLSDFLQRIGILPYILILFIGVFIYVLSRKNEK